MTYFLYKGFYVDIYRREEIGNGSKIPRKAIGRSSQRALFWLVVMRGARFGMSVRGARSRNSSITQQSWMRFRSHLLEEMERALSWDLRGAVVRRAKEVDDRCPFEDQRRGTTGAAALSSLSDTGVRGISKDHFSGP